MAEGIQLSDGRPARGPAWRGVALLPAIVQGWREYSDRRNSVNGSRRARTPGDDIFLVSDSEVAHTGENCREYPPKTLTEDGFGLKIATPGLDRCFSTVLGAAETSFLVLRLSDT
jgi:hypothetical protein